MGRHTRPYTRPVPRATSSRRFAKALASFAELADPLARLAEVRAARRALEALEAQTVAEARASGATWGEIGALYGISKQAAQQRFGHGDGVPRGKPKGR
jgi:hypothetical protein